MNESVDDYSKLFMLKSEELKRKNIPYHGCIEEMTDLVRGLGMNTIRSLREMFDPYMSVACGHPCLSICRLEDEIMERYQDYTHETCMNDWLLKHDPNNIELWKYYLGVLEDIDAMEDFKPTKFA